MKDWFQNLDAREQLFVAIGGAVVSLIILWASIWLPLSKGHDNLRANVDNWQRSLSELRSLGATMQAGSTSSNTPRVSSNESAVVIVDRTLRARNLRSERQQPTPNGIRVEFENVAFDQLVLWLGDLNTTYSMEVQAGSLSTASRAGPGRINASLTFERTP